MLPTNQLVALADLAPHPRNYNRHPAAQVRKLAQSLRKFGQVRSVVVWRSTILAGHGVVEAAKSLKWQHIRADVLPDDYPEHLALAYVAADNELARQGDPDMAQLATILEEVKDVDAELLEAVGYSDAEFAALLEEVGGEQRGIVDAEPQIDRAEELRKKWRVEPGQLWRLGEHRLICGDCTDAAVVEKVLQGEKPALMVTDPPYGVNYDPNWRNEAAKAGFLSFAKRRTGIVVNDDRIDWTDAYLLFPGDVAYTWSPGGDHVIITGMALQKAGFQIRNQIVWVKPHFPISRGHYTYQHEPCWYGVRKGRKAHWIGGNNASTIWKISLDKNADGGHSTQKPLACMAIPIANHEGDVYDPFLGSGTTLIACENLGRRCRAVEIEPSYVAVALERWAQATGKTPELVNE
jgi:DNA modification methylase